jgi:6-phosphogluconolactonase/glucosamine-6-phosphate isomerase/deaminase
MGVHIKEFDSYDDAVEQAASRLADAVNRSVPTLLLLSGGSSVAVADKALDTLKPKHRKYITIAQIDERFGKPGHKDSNWNAIDDAAGDFNEYAGVAPILQGSGSIEEDSAYYDARLHELLKNNIIKVGLFGIGADGHIAGMLGGEQHSFLKYTDGRLVVNFKGSDFPRITTTRSLMHYLDEAVVFAAGPSKRKAVMDLKKTIEPHMHPAQLLKDTNEAWVFYSKE